MREIRSRNLQTWLVCVTPGERFFLSLLPVDYFFHETLACVNPSGLESECKPRKSADISRRHHWFPREMTSEEREQKFHTDDASLPRSE